MTTFEKPTMIAVQRPGDLGTPTVSITAAYQPRLGRYTATSVSVEHPFDEVKGAHLRSTPVRRLLADLLRQPLGEANPTLMENRAVKAWASGKTGRKPAAKQVATPDETHLRSAALVAAMEIAVGGFPIRAVERACGVEYSVARRWVRLARAQGLLP